MEEEAFMSILKKGKAFYEFYRKVLSKKEMAGPRGN